MARRDKEKNREYQIKWYKKNKALQIKRNAENCKRKKDWLQEFKKDKSCMICGESHPATLDFHHRNPDEKEDRVCMLVAHNRSIDNILKEIVKCDILCANCHRKLHYNDRL